MSSSSPGGGASRPPIWVVVLGLLVLTARLTEAAQNLRHVLANSDSDSITKTKDKIKPKTKTKTTTAANDIVNTEATASKLVQDDATEDTTKPISTSIVKDVAAEDTTEKNLRRLAESSNNDQYADDEVEPDFMYWVTPIASLGLTCGGSSIKSRDGEYTCIKAGEALCQDNDGGPFGRWTFGITEDNQVNLWTPKNEVAGTFCTEVSHVCIGEESDPRPDKYSNQRPYLYFYDEKTQRTVGNLTCDGTDGFNGENLDKPTILKMVDNSNVGMYAKYNITVLKFRKGQTPDPGDSNELLNITVSMIDEDIVASLSFNDDKCTWTDTCERVPRLSTQNVINSFLAAGVPEALTNQFPVEIFELISRDSPTGFVPGTVELFNPTATANLPFDFETQGPTLVIDGVFSAAPPLLNIPAGLFAKVYSQAGLVGVGQVDVNDGSFSIRVFSIFPGNAPFLITFSSVYYDVLPTRRLTFDEASCQQQPILKLYSGYVSSGTTHLKPSVRFLQGLLNNKIAAGLVVDGLYGPKTEAAVKTYQETVILSTDGIVGPATWASLCDGAKSTPSLIYIDRGDLCSNLLTVKLTWDKPTADIDLHVIEPGGKEVYFQNQVGDSGYLDYDDTEGYGPEYYTTTVDQLPPEGSFVIFSRLYDIDEDEPPISFRIDAVNEDTNTLLVATGQLSAQNEDSMKWTLDVRDISNSGCKVCYPEPLDANTKASLDSPALALEKGPNRHLGGTNIDYTMLPSKCDGCPIDELPKWCYAALLKAVDPYDSFLSFAAIKLNPRLSDDDFEWSYFHLGGPLAKYCKGEQERVNAIARIQDSIWGKIENEDPTLDNLRFWVVSVVGVAVYGTTFENERFVEVIMKTQLQDPVGDPQCGLYYVIEWICRDRWFAQMATWLEVLIIVIEKAALKTALAGFIKGFETLRDVINDVNTLAGEDETIQITRLPKEILTKLEGAGYAQFNQLTTFSNRLIECGYPIQG